MVLSPMNPRAGVVRGVQVVNEHQAGHLLDEIQRVGQSAGPNISQGLSILFLSLPVIMAHVPHMQWVFHYYAGKAEAGQA